MNLYYSVWVDCIVRIKSQPTNKESWKGLSLFAMTMTMSLNYAIIMTVFQKCIGDDLYNINIDVFPGKKLDSALTYFILYFAPMLLINYWFIFRNKRYDSLIQKYKYHNGKRFFVYFYGTLSLILVLVFFVV